MATLQPTSKPAPHVHDPVYIDKQKLKKAFDVSRFDVNAILRGIQLTLVGGKQAPQPILLRYLQLPSGQRLTVRALGIVHRALQNPAIFTSEHYRQAAIAVAAGIAIRLIITIPVSPG